MQVGKTFTFDAAHRLQNHNGKCRNLHGHTYRVDVTIFGATNEEDGAPDEGMVLDFGELKEWWKRDGEPFDHVTILQHSDPLVTVLTNAGQPVVLIASPPTAENLAYHFAGVLADWLLERWPRGFQSPRVRVYEQPTSWAEA